MFCAIMFDADNGILFEQDATGLWAVRRANTGAGVIDTCAAMVRADTTRPANSAGTL